MDYILTPPSMLPTVSIEEGKSMQSTELCSLLARNWEHENHKWYDQVLLTRRLAKFLLSLPHSYADTEREFSIVWKIITDYCTENRTEYFMCPCNMNDSTCFELYSPKELLTKVKSSTMDYNKAHSHTDTLTSTQ